MHFKAGSGLFLVKTALLGDVKHLIIMKTEKLLWKEMWIGLNLKLITSFRGIIIQSPQFYCIDIFSSSIYNTKYQLIIFNHLCWQLNLFYRLFCFVAYPFYLFIGLYMITLYQLFILFWSSMIFWYSKPKQLCIFYSIFDYIY